MMIDILKMKIAYDMCNMLLFTLAGNSLMEVDSFLVLLAIVRWNQILLFIRFI